MTVSSTANGDSTHVDGSNGSTSVDIPSRCTVLVIGGGPGGSYAASALAREGVDTVLLEAATFPRYHVGESMLASIRHLLRFIDLDSTFDSYGFFKKVGAAFKLNPAQREGYTDFLAAGGPNNYAWNVVRSESDHLIFKHAGKSGAKTFDGVKITEIRFSNDSPTLTDGSNRTTNGSHEDPGRPVSASYTRISDGTKGTIDFDYVVDASGRAGIVSSKYTKSRIYNQGLKNVANWGYWKGTEMYGQGTSRASSPYFEALRDGSGWVWMIPLHNGTTSVGVVMNQDFATSKKKMASSPKDFYLSSLNDAPNIQKFLSQGALSSELKSASDFSYSSSSYASPYLRIVGDAGCFIDPFFSSGVHLAMVSALSAATTICAAIRGDCEEQAAADWHSKKVADGYQRFLLVVLSAYKHMGSLDAPVLSDVGEDNLDKAFDHFKPVIQGTADVSANVSQQQLSATIDFCSNAWDHIKPEMRGAIMKKMKTVVSEAQDSSSPESADAKLDAMKENLSAEEKRVMDAIRAHQLMRREDAMHIDNFTTDVINGMAPQVISGQLTLVKAAPMVKDAPKVEATPMVETLPAPMVAVM